MKKEHEQENQSLALGDFSFLLKQPPLRCGNAPSMPPPLDVFDDSCENLIAGASLVVENACIPLLPELPLYKSFDDRPTLAVF